MFVRVVVCVFLVACSGGSAVPDAQSVPDGAVPDSAVPVDTVQSSITVDRMHAEAGVEQVTVTVTVKDGTGAPLVDVDVALVASGADNTFSQPPRTNASGQTTATWSSTHAEAKSVSAVIGGVTVPGPIVTFAPGPATKLGFATQPTNLIAGQPFTPQLVVETQDAFGNVVDTDTGYVVVVLAANPGGTSLRGQIVGFFTDGVAAIPNAHIDVAGVGYSLTTQSDLTLDAATSEMFDVTWGAPSALTSTIVAVPHSLEANGIDTTTIKFHVANAYNIALAAVPVTLAISGTNNMLAPSSGNTDSKGDFFATLSSTTAETKVISGTDGQMMVMGSAIFHPAGCTPMLPGGPKTPFEGYATAVHAADVDGDGSQDVIVGQSQQILVYRGRGNGLLDAAISTALTTTGEVNAIRSGDFNGDGKLDLVVSVTNDNALTILLGTGDAHFTTLSSALTNYAKQLAVADFNGDGKADVLAALPYAQKLVVKLGIGDGTFTDGGSITADAYTFEVSDVNGDGKVDVLISSGSALSTALGNGNGTFQTATNVSASDGLILIGDFNADGKTDAAVANSTGVLTPYLGNGAGTFTAAASVVYRDMGAFTLMPWAGAVKDLDGDNRLDVIVGAGGQTSVLKGNGAGTFAIQGMYSAAAHEVADMNNDGAPDVISITGSGIAVVPSNGLTLRAPLEIYRSSTGNGRLFDTLADFDGNGKLDYVRFRSENLQGISVMLTQSDGSVVQATSSASTQEPYETMAGDFTGDGKEDVAIINAAVNGVTLSIAAGDGAGGLGALTTQSIAGPYVMNMTPGDLDGDGKADLVLFSRGSPNFSTAFSTGAAFGPLSTYTAEKIDTVIVRDLNGDDRNDVIVVSETTTATVTSVYLNDGGGDLLPPATYGRFLLLGVVDVADMTGDGVVDLVFLEGNPTSARRMVLVYPGLGDGTFGAAIETPNVRIPQMLDYERLHVFDVTGDGDADLVVHSNQGTAVIAGYGDGNVRQTSRIYALGYQGGAWVGGSPIDPVVVSDHNGDGRLDLVYWNAGLFVARNAACVP